MNLLRMRPFLLLVIGITLGVGMVACSQKKPATATATAAAPKPKLGKLSVIRQIDQEKLPFPLPIPMTAEVVSQEVDDYSPEPGKDFWVYLRTDNFPAVIHFYEGVFWARESARYRTKLDGKSTSDVHKVTELKPGDTYQLALVQNGYYVSVETNQMKPDEKQYSKEKPYLVRVFISPQTRDDQPSKKKPSTEKN